MKSTFIKHAPYAQMTTLEGHRCLAVRVCNYTLKLRSRPSVDMQKVCTRVRIYTSLVIYYPLHL